MGVVFPKTQNVFPEPEVSGTHVVKTSPKPKLSRFFSPCYKKHHAVQRQTPVSAETLQIAKPESFRKGSGFNKNHKNSYNSQNIYNAPAPLFVTHLNNGLKHPESTSPIAKKQLPYETAPKKTVENSVVNNIKHQETEQKTREIPGFKEESEQELGNISKKPSIGQKIEENLAAETVFLRNISANFFKPPENQVHSEDSLKLMHTPPFNHGIYMACTNTNEDFFQCGNGNESPGAKLREIQLLFQKGNKIGKGPHGKVYESLNLNTGEILAVKTIAVEHIELNTAFFFQNNLLQLNHENVLAYTDFGIAVESNEQEIDMVSEYIAGGSLKNLLEKFGKFEEVVSALFTSQILNGLQFLHSKSILHKNLKSTNCLVESNGTIKLSDYHILRLGFAQPSAKSESNNDNSSLVESKSFTDSCKSEDNNNNEVSATFDEKHWMAPETFYHHEFYEKSDIWSLGCIVFEMLNGESLLSRAFAKNLSIDEYYEKVAELIEENIVSEISKEFLLATMKKKLEDRASLKELMDFRFIKSPNMNFLEEDKEAMQELSSNNINEKSSLVSKSNFSILASFINNSFQESLKKNKNFNSRISDLSNNLSKKPVDDKKKSALGGGCYFKKKTKTNEIEKVIEEKEMERSLVFNSATKEKTVDYNARKRMEFEKKLLKELEGN